MIFLFLFYLLKILVKFNKIFIKLLTFLTEGSKNMLELEHFNEFINQKPPHEVFYRLSNEENMRKVLSYCHDQGVTLCTSEPLTEDNIKCRIDKTLSRILLSNITLLGYINEPKLGAKSRGVYFYDITDDYIHQRNPTIYEPVFVDYNAQKTNLLNWINRRSK